ncbi:MAG: hypothetical protein DI535_26465 [Citrobacter freundii]|nr:MAG: hypothetical protein DI535_26465 [Citrobacter freundii]
MVYEGNLLVKTNRNTPVALRPASEKFFFINKETPVAVAFIKHCQLYGMISNMDLIDEYKKTKY